MYTGFRIDSDLGVATPGQVTFVSKPLNGGVLPAYNTNVRAIFSGSFYVSNAGTYTWTIKVDDDSRYYIGGDLAFDNWLLGCCTTRTFTKSLVVGWHDIHIDWWQGNGGMECTIQWQGPSLGKQDMTIVQRSNNCNWVCYHERYTSLASLGGDWEKLKNDYHTLG